MMKNKAKVPTWSKAMRAFIISELAAWKPMHDVYECVTSVEFEVNNDIARLNSEIHTYPEFRKRCRKISPEALAEAHELWTTRFTGIRWSEERARIEGLAQLADRLLVKIDKLLVGDTGLDLADVKLISEFRMLLEQVRKERAADFERAQSLGNMGKVLATNPNFLELSPPLLMELILVSRAIIGGLHNLEFAALNMRELELLEFAVQTAKAKKINQLVDVTQIEESTTNVNEDEDDEL
jgi:hypothetical protein